MRFQDVAKAIIQHRTKLNDLGREFNGVSVSYTTHIVIYDCFAGHKVSLKLCLYFY